MLDKQTSDREIGAGLPAIACPNCSQSKQAIERWPDEVPLPEQVSDAPLSCKCWADRSSVNELQPIPILRNKLQTFWHFRKLTGARTQKKNLLYSNSWFITSNHNVHVISETFLVSSKLYTSKPEAEINAITNSAKPRVFIGPKLLTGTNAGGELYL